MSIGEKIKLARQEKGYTQLELSKKLGISRSTVACYESERRTPVFKDIQHLSSVLGVSVDYFSDNTPEFNRLSPYRHLVLKILQVRFYEF